MRLVVIALVLAGCDYTFQLDRLSAPPPPDAPQPDAAEMCVTDEFPGSLIAGHWSTFSPAPIAVTQNEQLQIDLGTATTGEGGARYNRAFDLTGGYVQVEVSQAVANHSNVENYLRLRVGNTSDNGYVIRYGAGFIDFRSRVANVYEIHVVRTYDPVMDRFWRITNGPELDQMTFATSADGEVWRLETMQPKAVAVDNIQILLVAGVYAGGTGATAPGAAHYDNFAVCNAQLR